MPTTATSITEDLLTGARALRRAFLAAPTLTARRGSSVIRADEREASPFLIRRGFAYCSHILADGRRAIVDVLVPGDVAGIDHVIVAKASGEIVAGDHLSYQALSPDAIRALMKGDPNVHLRVTSLLAEANWRAHRHATTIMRLEARERIAAFIMSIYQRLRQRGLINGLTFNLPLTQEEIADHLGLTLVHVNRTLRRLREEGLVLVDRHVVIIRDYQGLRDVLSKLPEPAYVPSPMLPTELTEASTRPPT